MFCSNCGKKIFQTGKFCANCGLQIAGVIKTKVAKKKDDIDKSLPKDQLDSLIKRYSKTGNLSMVLCFLSLIIFIGLSLDDKAFGDILLEVIILTPFLIPYYYFGKKLKENNASNLYYALKVTRGMLVYTTVFIVINFIYGGIGWLWLILQYYFYKSYKETKNALIYIHGEIDIPLIKISQLTTLQKIILIFVSLYLLTWLSLFFLSGWESTVECFNKGGIILCPYYFLFGY